MFLKIFRFIAPHIKQVKTTAANTALVKRPRPKPQTNFIFGFEIYSFGTDYGGSALSLDKIVKCVHSNEIFEHFFACICYAYKLVLTFEPVSRKLLGCTFLWHWLFCFQGGSNL